jgi:hypothetical protein
MQAVRQKSCIFKVQEIFLLRVNAPRPTATTGDETGARAGIFCLRRGLIQRSSSFWCYLPDCERDWGAIRSNAWHNGV